MPVNMLQSLCHIVRTDVLRIHPFDIDGGVLGDAAVFQRLDDTDVGIVELCIFSDQSDRDLLRG